MSVKGASLTGRDLAVTCDVYKYRYLSASQVRRLHFPSLQTAWRRLRALTEAGYLSSFTVPNVPERIFYLESKGAEAVAAQLGVEISELGWSRTSHQPKDYYFLRHFLQVSDFRITLSQAAENSDVRLRGFIPEYVGERNGRGAVRKYIRDVVCDVADPAAKISHTPDAVFALERGDTPALFFLEIDRGTEVVSDEEKGVLKCVKFYASMLVGGQYQRYREDFRCGPFKGFRALIVTTSEARVGNIRRAAGRLQVDPKARRFIWLTESHRIGTGSIFQPLWLSADAADDRIYQIG